MLERRLAVEPDYEEGNEDDRCIWCGERHQQCEEEDESTYHLACTSKSVLQLAEATPELVAWLLTQHDRSGHFHTPAQRQAVIEAAKRVAEVLPHLGRTIFKLPLKHEGYRAAVDGQTYRVRWIAGHAYLYRRGTGRKDLLVGRVDDREAIKGPEAIPGFVQKLAGAQGG
jgi:hypothetical protein